MSGRIATRGIFGGKQRGGRITMGQVLDIHVLFFILNYYFTEVSLEFNSGDLSKPGQVKKK